MTEASGVPIAATAVVTATATKPGYKTTEFWMAAAAKVVGLLFASGVLADGSAGARIAGLAAMVLASAGYSVSRGMAKSGS